MTDYFDAAGLMGRTPRRTRVQLPRRLAVWVDCPGLQDGRYAHAMRDNCWNCAPFWERIPTCPDDGKKLTQTGYCRDCRKRFEVGR